MATSIKKQSHSFSKGADLHPSRFLWEASHAAAILETSNARLAERIGTAEEILFARLVALANRGSSNPEIRAIENALQELQRLRSTRLNQQVACL